MRVDSSGKPSYETMQSSEQAEMGVAPREVIEDSVGIQVEAELAEASGKSPGRREKLTAEQIQLKTSTKTQSRIVGVVLFAVLMDLLGTVLVFPTLGPLCQNANNGPVDQVLALPDEVIIGAGYTNHQEYLEAVVKPNPKAFSKSDIPFDFSLATVRAAARAEARPARRAQPDCPALRASPTPRHIPRPEYDHVLRCGRRRPRRTLLWPTLRPNR